MNVRSRMSTPRALMTMVLVSLLAILLLTASIQANQAGFSGWVRDIVTGDPIAGARIDVGDESVLTGEDGRYTIHVHPGQHMVRVHAAGYIGMSFVRQRVVGGQLLELEVEMIPSNPTPEEQFAIDAKLFETRRVFPSEEELALLRERGIEITAVESARRTVRVLMEDGTVVAMEMDEYLKGVVPNEVSAYWSPEALKAQAVAARCYASTANRYPDEEADVCTTECSQVWRPIFYDTTDRAVNETRGVVATYEGNVIYAFYFGHCDGHTRNVEDVWGSYVPYLRSVTCPCGEGFLFGHGVGMCQRGAKAMAEAGASYEEILRHYYSGVEVSGPSLPALSAPSLAPSDGDTTTLYTYEVTYTDRDDWPSEASLLIDGLSHTMTLISGEPWTGARYAYTTTLEEGEHRYSFQFDDGYGHYVRFPPTDDFSGPVVSERSSSLPTVTPTATPSAHETRARQWSHSTIEDWSRVVATDTVVLDEGGGGITLAPYSQDGIFVSSERRMSIPFNAVGASWRATLPQDTEMQLEIRARQESGDWSSWYTVRPGHARYQKEEPLHGNLVFVRGEWLQFRVTLQSSTLVDVPVVSSIVLTCINSEGGPGAEEAMSQARAMVPTDSPIIIPRSAWGADEALMHWLHEYRDPKVFIIHHTDTENDDQDPAATVRAIYYYHAVVRGWGDIGYNLLIDRDGRIYEGRSGGEKIVEGRTLCVVGGHAFRYNWGSIGIALLGNYEETEVPLAAQESLVQLLAWKGTEHLIHPLRETFFVDTELPNVMGHRDCLPTTCPGDRAYAQLPTWREQAVNVMRDSPPKLILEQPWEGSAVRAVTSVEVTASAAVTRTEFYLDGQLMAVDLEEPYVWRWNTTGSTGTHYLHVVGQVASGLTAGTELIAVGVDNSSPDGSVTAPEFTNELSVLLRLASADASLVQFSGDWIWEGEELQHQVGTVVSDTEALNGLAWLGRAEVDGAGYWYGPYCCDLPLCRDYQVYYRMKVADKLVAEEIARLDVVDDESEHTYAERILQGIDFVAPHTYEEFRLDFSYKGRHGTCLGANPTDGLEWRTLFQGVSDLYLDRVQVFTEPQPYTSSVSRSLPNEERIHSIQVRFLDGAGNYSPSRAVSVLLDMTAPEWLGFEGDTAQVRDPLSGIVPASAQYAISFDGGAWWLPWTTAVVSVTNGITQTVAVSGDISGATDVRFKIQDRATNWGESPAYVVALTPTLTPSASPTVATATPGPTVPTPTVSPSPTVTSTPSAFLYLPLVTKGVQ